MIEFQTLSDWRKRHDCRPSVGRESNVGPQSKPEQPPVISSYDNSTNPRGSRVANPNTKRLPGHAPVCPDQITSRALRPRTERTLLKGYCENRKGRRGAFCRFSKARSEAELNLPKLYWSMQATLYPPRPSLRMASMP